MDTKDQILEALRKQIEGYKSGSYIEKVGHVMEVGDGIARIAGLSDVASQELEQTFQKRYRDLTTRLMTSIGRTSVLQGAAEKALAPAARKELQKKLGSIMLALQAQNKTLSEAMNMFAAGGFQGAFANLNRVNDTVKSAEDILVGLEIDITTSN